MSYTKQSFHSGDILYASALNAMDNQIAANADAIAARVFDPIICWGDSLTYGMATPVSESTIDGATSALLDHQQRINYPAYLAQMTGRPVLNMGVSGETCQAIMARQGADPMITPAFEIPANTTPVQIGTFGADIYNYGMATKGGNHACVLGYGNAGINPVTIANVRGYMTADGQATDRTGIKYYFQRETAGSAVSVTAGTEIHTFAMRNLRKGIAIIWMGYNGQYSSKTDFIGKVNAMIEYGGYTDYLVVGCNEMYAGDSDYFTEWGDRYLYLKPLLGRIGAQEAGLWSDGDTGSNGIAEDLDDDGVHFNSYGCKAIASLIFKRLLENGSLDTRTENSSSEGGNSSGEGGNTSGEGGNTSGTSDPKLEANQTDTFGTMAVRLKANETIVTGTEYCDTGFALYDGTDSINATIAVKFSGTPTGTLNLISCRYTDNYGDNRGLGINYTTADGWDSVLGSNPLSFASGSVTVNESGSNVIIVRKSGSTYGVYCNGSWMYGNTSIGSSMDGILGALSNITVLIGASWGYPDTKTPGASGVTITDLRVYNSALTPENIAALYTAMSQ